MTIKHDFLQTLCGEFPNLNLAELEAMTSDQLLSPFQVEISQNILDQAQEAIQKIYQHRTQTEYIEKHSQTLEKLGLKNPGNKSIAMSYDFHVDSKGQLKIIEINTNAAFLVLGYYLYQAQKLKIPFADYSMDILKQNIINEINLNQNKNITHPRACITDDRPSEQRLYLEFLAYRELFQKWGWSAEIKDYREIDFSEYDFIYNRYTDFLLSDLSSAKMREAYNSRQACLSPQPYEYHFLSDKERLMEFYDVPEIQKFIPESFILTNENAEETWAKRKNFFIKPLRSFGSKQTYKGASISRKLFEELKSQNFMAQEYIQAPSQIFISPEGPVELKYDLRVYAYEGQAQLAIARLYSGQVTNMKTPYGGFATLKVV